MKKVIVAILIALIAQLIFIPISPVQADDYPLPPENPQQSWQPPVEGAEMDPPVDVEQYSGSLPEVQMAPQTSQLSPYVPGLIINAFLVDSKGQVLTNLNFNQTCYLIISFNGPGYFYLWEYYPSGMSSYGHWLCYKWYRPDAGVWRIGPFAAQPGDPSGRYTWRMWYESGGTWSSRLLSFYFDKVFYPPDIPSPMPVPAPIPEPVYYPEINSFTSSKTTIDAGDTVVLTWITTNASNVILSPDVGAVGASGSTSVTPASTSTYTLLAESRSGNQTSSTLTITVMPRVPPEVSLSSASIKRGEATTLMWNAPGAVNVSVTGIGNAGIQGSMEVSPLETTTYLVSASYIDGTILSAQATVEVQQPLYWLWALIALLVVVIVAVVIFLLIRRVRKTAPVAVTEAGTEVPTRPDTTVSTDTLPITTPLIEPPPSRLVMPDGNELLLAGDSRLLGRKDFEDFMPREDITYISRQHIDIWYENGNYYIEDRSSTNGTRINDREIKGTGRHALADGDVLLLASKLSILFKENSNNENTDKEVP